MFLTWEYKYYNDRALYFNVSFEPFLKNCHSNNEYRDANR